MRLRFCIFLLAFLASPCAFALTWTLTTADFNKSIVTVRAFDDHNLTGESLRGQLNVPTNEVLRLSRDATPAPSPAFTVYLSNGDHIGGEIGDLKDDVLALKTSALGDMKFSLDNLRGLSRTPPGARLSEQRKEDQLTLTNHDLVRGVVSGIGAGKVLVQVNGDTTSIPLTSVDAILFASAPKPKPDTRRAFKVQLIDGSQITASSVSLSRNKATLNLPGGVRETDEANLLSIEQVNGPVQWLSDLQPILSEQASFSSESGFPAKMDRSVFGRPLRIGSEVYERGIGVHANSKLVFPLDGKFKVFRTRCGIDTNADAEKADVNVRVLLDDKVVYQKQHFRAADDALILANLGQAKSLTLEVTAAGPTDAQDRFDWIEAALLREAPPAATKPATAPAH